MPEIVEKQKMSMSVLKNKKKQIEVAAVYNFLSQKIEENTAVNDNLANHSAMVA